MEEFSFSLLFAEPHQNGFLIFTLGILFILSVYHFLLYFQHKDKVYLLYSGYTFFIFLSQQQWIEGGFLYPIFKSFGRAPWQPIVFTEIYYILYALFAFSYLNIKQELPNWYRICMLGLKIVTAYCLLKFTVYLFVGRTEIVLNGYFIFTVLMSVLGIVMYIPFFKSNNLLKYYMIVGSLLLFVTSITSLVYYSLLLENGSSVGPAYSILYCGFILENIVFSLGLGHKQKLILQERNTSQQALINQYVENERLRKKIQQQLEQDVETLNKQAEIKRLEAKKLQYDKELAELTVASLRNQMNPHFIFNSLNSIKRYIIDNDKKEAVFYLNKFSKFIRKILGSTSEKETSLEEELDMLELYMNIENTRLNKTIIFNLIIEEGLNLTNIKVPPLITQPFIENAIWHGLALKKNNRKLTVRVFKIEAKHLQIDIEDNGIGRARSQEIKEKKLHRRTSVGIKLSEDRLKYFSNRFKGRSKIFFTDLQTNNKPTGTKVTLVIPME